MPVTIGASNLAYGVGALVKNVQFQADAAVIPRIVGVFAQALGASITANNILVGRAALVTSPEYAGSLYGFGSAAHRLVQRVFDGSNGSVKVWVIPETDGGAAATGTITTTAATPGNGTYSIYVAGKQYSVATTSISTPTTITAALAALIQADPLASVTAAGAVGVLTLTAKQKGLYGNTLTLAVSSQPGDALPFGVSGAVVAMAGGTGASTVAADLITALGSGSQANTLPDGTHLTDVVHGWGQDAATLTAFSAYNENCWDNAVAAPFRVLTGDNLATGGAALTSLLTLGTTNINDRTNGILAVPGSLTPVNDIAAVAIGVMAAINKIRAEESYVGNVLPGVDPGYACAVAGNNWAQQYTNRDTAVQGGISPTVVSGSAVTLQNVVTFYHPASVPVKSNSYREMVNISKHQNILASIMSNFRGEKWQGYTVVIDTKYVTDPDSRQKVRDTGSVIDDLTALAYSWAAHGWIADPLFTIRALQNTANPAVTIRVGGDGFAAVIPIVMSGVGGIITTEVDVDTSFAVLSN